MAMAHEEIVEIFNRVKFPYSVNKLTSKVAHEALSNTRGMKDNVRKILEERKKLVAELKKLPYVKKVRIPEGGYSPYHGSHYSLNPRKLRNCVLFFEGSGIS